MFFIWVYIISNWSWLICGRSTCFFWPSDDVQRRLYLPFFTEQIPICVVCLCVFCPASTLALEQVHSLSWRGVQLLWQMSSLCSPYKNVFFFSHIIKVFLFTHNKWSVLASLLVCDHTLLSILVLCVGPFNDLSVFVPSLLQTLCLTGKQWQTAGFFSAPLRVGKASHSRYGTRNSMDGL